MQIQRVIGAVTGLAACTGAVAQWVDFADETDARLSLSSVELDDVMEKDIVAADFDDDGWMDLVVVRKIPFSNPGKRTDVLLMNEAGVLTDRTSVLAPGFLETPTDARDVAAADVDADGDIDLIVASTFGQLPSLYINLGWDKNGEWLGFTDESERVADVSPLSTPTEFLCVDVGDIDGDGDIDLYYGNRNGRDDLLQINDGAGFFTDETALRLGDLASVAFGARMQLRDVDLDGDLDILKLTTLFQEPPFSLGLFVLWNNGDGTFTDFDDLPKNSPYDFDTGDYDNDGDLDVWVVQDQQDWCVHATVDGPNNVSWEVFQPVHSPRTNSFGGNPRSVDIDDDGDLDVMVSPVDVDVDNCDAGQFTLLENKFGQFGDPWVNDQPWHTSPFDAVAIDINNDGCLDMFQGLCEGWRVFIQTCANDCYADFDANGALNILDFVAYQLAFQNGDLAADCNGDGELSILDFVCFQEAFTGGC